MDWGERRMLSELYVRLGQEGRKSGESLAFDLKVLDVSKTVSSKDVLVNIPQCILFSDDRFEQCGGGKKGDTNVTYPKVAKVAMSISGTLSEDWIDDATKAQSGQLRNVWIRYNSGMNGWKRNRTTGDWLPCKPISPNWGQGDEFKIIGLLINSGCTFKKSW